MTDPRLKIAVFIDFDNIEIGVKTTLNTQFDIGVVLEAIKERGEVVTKIAYSDWKRAGDYSRQLSQHAIRMVQRNLTPGGDKNGADINLALDALEMAFTHDHINAFVIVGGDSDFITLVEKLKQYDKKVFVVGGRQFTSLVMQKNCHEFVAYENLAGSTRRSSTGSRTRSGPSHQVTDVDKALPLVKRALKVLSDREVTPQLGLLKSTLLQLDSTFSERSYGASTFRDFIEKVAEGGLVTLKQAGRSVLVELADSAAAESVPDSVAGADTTGGGEAADSHAAEIEARVRSGREEGDERSEERRPEPTADQLDAVRVAAGIFARARQTPRWPMYIRQIRQFLRNADESFDERKFGFTGIVEFLRACQREGLLRLERDRQGVLRVFAGPSFGQPAAEPGTASPGAAPGTEAEPLEQPAGQPVEPVEVEVAAAPHRRFTRITDEQPPVIDATPVEVRPLSEDDLSVGPGNDFHSSGEAALIRRGRVRKTARPATRKTAAAPKTPRPRAPRKTTKPKV